LFLKEQQYGLAKLVEIKERNVMSQVGELVKYLEDDKKNKCEFKPDETTWTANLKVSSDTLGTNLDNKPDSKNESQLSSSDWPSQAHHLIPHLTIADHDVKDFLKTGDILYGDTKYNVDHKNNGKWMPYASSRPEWKIYNSKKKRALMYKVMGLAGIQLHQEPHSKKNKYGIGDDAYKQRVTTYLDKIQNNGASHFAKPNPCQDCKENINKYPPRNNTVRYVDRASSLIEKDIDNCRIFVSRRVAEFAEAGGFN
jgi:hypothetical protein